MTTSTTQSRAARLTSILANAPRVDLAGRDAVLDYVHSLQAEGPAVLPVVAGGKEPATTNGVHGASTDGETFDGMYVDGMNLGVALGASQLAVIDADTPAEVAVLRKWWTDAKGGAPLPAPTTRTPGSASKGHSDGGHWYFDLTQAADLDMSSLSKLTNFAGVDGQKGFDLMAGGCYVLLPGCVRTDVADGAHDAYVAGEKGTVRVLDPLGVGDPVLDLLTGRARAARAKATTVTDVDTIDYTPGSRDHYLAQWFAAVGWQGVLPAGWEVTGHADCGCEVWHRPGGVSPRSAIAHDAGCRRGRTDEKVPGMYFASTGIAEVETLLDETGDRRRTLSCFDVYAALNFDGDRAAAAEAAGLPRVIGDLSQLGVNFSDAELWEAHPMLSRIKFNARVWKLNPFTLLAAVLVRMTQYIDPTYVLDVPRTVGLNLFVAACARQGGGKGRTFDNSRRMVTGSAGNEFAEPDLLEINDFTGEGAASALERPVDDDGHPVGYVSALIREDEAGNLFTRWSRRDATIITTLNKVFMSEAISAVYSDKKKNRKVGAHDYRCSAMLGVQFKIARPLLTGEALNTGLTARFLYVDTRVFRRDKLPGPADLDELVVVDMEKIETDDVPGFPGLKAIRTDPSLLAHIDDVAGAANEEDDDTDLDDVAALDDWDGADGHRGLVKRKVATLLAIMFGDPVVEWTHWHYAEYVVANSDRVRRRLTKFAAYVAAQTETERKIGENRDAKLDERVAKAAEWFADRLTTSPEGVPWSKLTADGPAKRKAWPDAQVEQIRALLADGADERIRVVRGKRGKGWKVRPAD